jgi:hypothetical protein
MLGNNVRVFKVNTDISTDTCKIMLEIVTVPFTVTMDVQAVVRR